jgi:hypothetical protein
MDFKFALRDFAGKPVSHYIVREVTPPKPEVEKQVAHHIVVVDRSGSMYGVMADTRAMVEKVMTIEEYKDSELLLSLISYSSEGDVTTHFARRKVSDILTPGSVEIENLRQMRATSLTCASQALESASNLIQDETTAITLHTDGWFNDASPASEKKKIEKTLKGLEAKPNVFINCVAYGNYTDFSYLSTIANRMSGACIVAENVKQVYDALHDTTALLAGRVTPAIPVGIGDADWQIALNISQRKVNGAATDLIVRGSKPEDQLHVYRFSKVNATTYAKTPEVEAMVPNVIAAFARTKLAEGKINESKFALVALKNTELLQKHYNALSTDRLRAFATDLESIMNGERALSVAPEYGLPVVGKSLIEVFRTIQQHGTSGAVAVHLPKFMETYNRRGVRRLNGTFDASGVFQPNAVELVERDSFDADPYVEVTGFSVNTSEATINMMITRAGEIRKNGVRVPRIAGRAMNPEVIKSYTVVADGEVNAPILPLLVSDKTLLAELKNAGWAPADAEVGKLIEIPLAQFPVVPLEVTALTPPSAEEMDLYLKALVAEKVIKAVLPAGATAKYEWTPEQTEELKAHGLTPNLFFSAPSTNPYSDRDKAIAEGWIDAYTRYSVSFGLDYATDLRTSLWSANEMLQRFYEVEGIKKPKFSDLLGAGAQAMVIYSAKVIKKPVLLDKPVFAVLSAMLDSGVLRQDADVLVSTLTAHQTVIRNMERRLSDIALYVGSTGLIPEDWNAEIVTAEQLEAKYPTMDIPKAHAEGTFFSVNGVFIGVHANVEWYSTAKGLEEADKLSA